MEGLRRLFYEVKKGSTGEPVIIEVSIPFERMIRHCLARVNVPSDKVSIERFTIDGQPMLRFVCPTFPTDRIEEFSWHAGEWYVRYHPLLNQHLN